DGSEGKSVRCTACGAVFPVGGAAAPSPPVSPASAPVAQVGGATSRPAVQPALVHDAAQAPPRPRRITPNEGERPARWSGALIAVLIVAVVGLVLMVPAVGCLGVIAFFSLKTPSASPQVAVDVPPRAEVPAPAAPAPAPVPPAPRPREPQAE